MALCTFEARVPEGCDCRLAVRRGADGAGGGVLKRVVAGERLEALRCDDEALASFAVRLECDAATGCVSSPPADLAPAAAAVRGRADRPARVHIGRLEALPAPAPSTRFKNPARLATPTPERASSRRPRALSRLVASAARAAITVALVTLWLAFASPARAEAGLL